MRANLNNGFLSLESADEIAAYEKRILAYLGSDEKSSFHLCASGAEAINSVLFSHYYDTIRHTGKNHLITLKTEAASTLYSLQRLEEFGCAAHMLSLNDQGQITRDVLLKALKPRVGFVSLSWADALTGVIQPVADLAELCAEKNITLHVDGTHVLGKIYFGLQDFPLDFFTFELNEIGGVIVKEQTPYTPLILGKDAPSLISLGMLEKALEFSIQNCDHLCLETARLRDKLQREIKNAFPDAVIFFEEAERLSNCCAIAFPKISAEALLYLLHRRQVAGTIGGGVCQRLSHILVASGVDPLLAESAVSFSLSYETSEKEIDYAIETIITCVRRLRQCSVHLSEV